MFIHIVYSINLEWLFKLNAINICRKRDTHVLYENNKCIQITIECQMAYHAYILLLTYSPW